MVEVLLMKGEVGFLICDKSGKVEEVRNDVNEVVLMDVDVFVLREVLFFFVSIKEV